MAMLSNGQPVALTPRDQTGAAPVDPDNPEAGWQTVVFYVQPPSLYSWPEFKRQLAIHGAELLSDAAILQQVLTAVRQAVPEAGDPDRMAAEALLHARLAEIDGGPQLSDAQNAGLIDLFQRLRGLPVVAQALTARAHFWDVARIEAPRLFLAGWEGRPESFRHGLDGTVPLNLIAGIPEAQRDEITAEVLRLRAPTGAEKGNSPSPSSGRSKPATSRAAKTPRGKARSGASAGKPGTGQTKTGQTKAGKAAADKPATPADTGAAGTPTADS